MIREPCRLMTSRRCTAACSGPRGDACARFEGHMTPPWRRILPAILEILGVRR